MIFLKVRLIEEIVNLIKGYDVVCGFVNDNINKEIIDIMVENGIKFLVMRCVGFNNVFLKDVNERFKVVRVFVYLFYVIVEYIVGFILVVNRKINKVYVCIREGNFFINGLMGIDLYEKIVGIIGIGKIG